jgi:60 kDa SS-A/Ro ribonucleoprotein
MSFLRQPVQPTHVPQMQRANDRESENAAGGFVYAVDAWSQLDRFLTIGTAGGTYYVDQAKLTDENAGVIHALLAQDGPRVVARAVEISAAGRAVKQDYALYVLALAAASADFDTRAAAYAAIPQVCRTASTLFQLVSYLKGRRGWSRGLRNAFARWYGARDVDALAYQFVKYAQRHTFSTRDLLRLVHPSPVDGSDARSVLYRWAVGKEVATEALPIIVRQAEQAKTAEGDDRVMLARTLPREALPTEWLNDPKIWEALLYGGHGRGMPLAALIRNLGNLSKCGLLVAGSDATEYVAAQLTNAERIKAARVHPMAIFLAAKTYAAGRGVRGSGEWAPVGAVVDALEAGFALAFGNVAVTGKEMLVAVDSSGSMSAPIAGFRNVSAREASIAFALITLRSEPHARLLGFTDGSNTTEFKVAADERLRDLLARFDERVEGRATDCAIPFTWAVAQGMKSDAVLIWSDSETWAGGQHPDAALRALRKSSGKAVRVVVAATTASGYSIGDPSDPLVLNIAGFDAAVPTVISEFLA